MTKGRINIGISGATNLGSEAILPIKRPKEAPDTVMKNKIAKKVKNLLASESSLSIQYRIADIIRGAKTMNGI
jgi:hypothetical protein